MQYIYFETIDRGEVAVRDKVTFLFSNKQVLKNIFVLPLEKWLCSCWHC